MLGGDKTAEYGVTVKGDVAQGSRVKVEPQDDVDERDGVNFVMTASGVGGSKNVDVTQDDLYWNYAEIVANDFEGTEKPGTVNGSELTFGIWQGNLTFLINFEDEYKDTGDTEDYSGIEDWEYELDEIAKIITLKKYIGAGGDVAVHSHYNIDGTIYKAQFDDVTGDVFGGDGSSWINSITFDDNFDTSNVTDMSYLFNQLDSIYDLNLSMFDTSNVMNMSHMFYGCDCLSWLDLSSFDTSHVTDMSYMFYHNDLSSLDLSSFDTSHVTDMNHMLAGNRYESLDLSRFNTSHVTDMGGMFHNCFFLQSLDLSSFDTSHVTNMAEMFYKCETLESLNLSTFDTSNVKSMYFMFCGCGALQSLDLKHFNTSNVVIMQSMFASCDLLQLLDITTFDTSNVTDMSVMFYNCPKLQSLNLTSFDTSCVTKMSYMFSECGMLSDIKVSSNWNTENVYDQFGINMFDGCGTDHVTYVD